ncbi:helix-turn-helix domain-containing protein [Epilithonimonas sp.]|uniref:helix-turn-helix domain-containing protein n=1 Tax=Epilithonimonas sp. TaxID=2894511 RepID=UPI0028A7D54B|nr:helix-turn-helix domain-containing protein [Epilithonimonas sp.]
MNLTFDQLPEAVTNLTKEVSELKQLLISKEQHSAEQPEKFLTIQQAAAFLSLSVPTIYSKVSKRELPFMKQGKRLYFSLTELTEYLKNGKKKTFAEVEAEAGKYLSKNKKSAAL